MLTPSKVRPRDHDAKTKQKSDLDVSWIVPPTPSALANMMKNLILQTSQLIGNTSGVVDLHGD